MLLGGMDSCQQSAFCVATFMRRHGNTWRAERRYSETPVFDSLVSCCALSRDLTRCTIRESLKYLCHPDGPRASNVRNTSEGFISPPREALDKAELTATDAIAARSTGLLRLPETHQSRR